MAEQIKKDTKISSPLLEDAKGEGEHVRAPWVLYYDLDIYLQSYLDSEYDADERAEMEEDELRGIMDLLKAFYKKDESLKALKRFLDK